MSYTMFKFWMAALVLTDAFGLSFVIAAARYAPDLVILAILVFFSAHTLCVIKLTSDSQN